MIAWMITGSEEHGEFFSDEWYIDSSDGEPVAIVKGEGNARRIHAIPEMLAALEFVAADDFAHDPRDRGIVLAAIAKAKGEV